MARSKLAKKQKSKVGQAPALSARDWQRWVKYVLEHHTTQMAVLIEFTGLFALRCGEACALKVSDLLLQANPPQLRIRKTKGAGKSPGSIPITPEKVEYIQKLQDEGLVWKRMGKNRHGSWNVMDTYKIPDKGHLFPSKKRKRKEKNKPITYHGVWSAVNKLGKGFAKKYPGNDFEKIRSHSGRATAITSMMGQGVSLPMSMKFARRKPGSMRVHLGYGQLTCMDVYQAVSCASPTQPVGPVTVQGPSPGGFLNGITLKNLVEWHEGNKLTAQEFSRAKQLMLGS
ncbi:Uncharacterized protein SCF082_LOCUS6766 [Durusdinium trenchii]|uniref:Tyr recombinase domain-containing protein n=1 Tax=Durusdinium trenchii TaxID=1381693 RepID=A0ABP0IFE0_9DINO